MTSAVERARLERAAEPSLAARLSRLVRRQPLEMAGAALALFAVAMAVIGPTIAPHDPVRVDFASALQAPSAAHWFGTDASGRDILSRLLFAARLSLTAVGAVLAIAVGLGTLVGTTAALGGRRVSDLLMRVTDVALSLPALLLALGIAAALGVSLRSAIFALGFATWPGYARLVRSLVLETREREFVEAARALGVSRLRLIGRHILPNSLQTLFVQTTLDVSVVLLSLSGLSFVGVGAQPPDAEWGAMIGDGRGQMLSAWWVVFFPGIAITATAVGFNLLGDLLRSELDPTLRRRGPRAVRRPPVARKTGAPEPTSPPGAIPLLSIRGLSVTFQTQAGPLRAVNRIDLDIMDGERVAIVGESGSGKTATAMSILGLLPSAVVEGEIRYLGRDLLAVGERERRAVRGAGISLILQDPLSSLNPSMSVGDQITESIRVRGVSPQVARARAVDLLGRVGIANAARRAGNYPHQFSGGMRQRVMIAIALIAEPRLLIADEPTSALDVRVQGQVLDLLDDLARERRMAVLLITHDLGIVAGFADRVVVMYAGKAVEEADTDGLFHRPVHPYTWGLLGSLPRVDTARAARLRAIPGQPPSPAALPSGCSFHPRCEFAQDLCRLEVPEFAIRSPGANRSACHFAGRIDRPIGVPGRGGRPA